MINFSFYSSPVGQILIAERDKKLLGVWIEETPNLLSKYGDNIMEQESDLITKTKLWLNNYFAGKNPSVTKFEYDLIGTEFQKLVWKFLRDIPYGQTTTYKQIAKKVANALGKNKMSSQAIGGAVGKNPISIIIPCHRVIGTNGKMIGYASGVDKKIFLLKLEGVL